MLTVSEKRSRMRVLVWLLKEDLVMQLHKYCYILPPFSNQAIPKPSLPCPEVRLLCGCMKCFQEFRALVAKARQVESPPFDANIGSLIELVCANLLKTRPRDEASLFTFSRIAE